jgi:hypothetical protein
MSEDQFPDRYRTVWNDRPQAPKPVVHPAWRKEQQGAADNLKARLRPAIEVGRVEAENVKKVLPQVAAVLAKHDEAFAKGYGSIANADLYLSNLRTLGDPLGEFALAVKEYNDIGPDSVADPHRRDAVLQDLVNEIDRSIRNHLNNARHFKTIVDNVAALKEKIDQHNEHYAGQESEPPRPALPTRDQKPRGPIVQTNHKIFD